VDAEVASNYAREQGVLYMETSAKTGQNVIDLFNDIANRLPKEKKGDSHKTGGAGFSVSEKNGTGNKAISNCAC